MTNFFRLQVEIHYVFKCWLVDWDFLSQWFPILFEWLFQLDCVDVSVADNTGVIKIGFDVGIESRNRDLLSTLNSLVSVLPSLHRCQLGYSRFRWFDVFSIGPMRTLWFTNNFVCEETAVVAIVSCKFSSKTINLKVEGVAYECKMSLGKVGSKSLWHLDRRDQSEMISKYEHQTFLFWNKTQKTCTELPLYHAWTLDSFAHVLSLNYGLKTTYIQWMAKLTFPHSASIELWLILSSTNRKGDATQVGATAGKNCYIWVVCET